VMPHSPFLPIVAGILAGGLAIISMGGDLFISLLKRQRQMKDTSNLLPGHGGILDRFDSLAAALPFFALAIALWGQ
ncbi:MAG: phosphatidate cytidylyltransferase, partial [Wenzhouxiangella sp.]